MKVADLEGALLDYWVAKADNRVDVVMENGEAVTYRSGGLRRSYVPSNDWGLAGPIIERERISIISGATEWRGKVHWLAVKDADVVAYTGEADVRGSAEGVGCAPLIAAMRCFVKSKYGEEVPDGND